MREQKRFSEQYITIIFIIILFTAAAIRMIWWIQGKKDFGRPFNENQSITQPLQDFLSPPQPEEIPSPVDSALEEEEPVLKESEGAAPSSSLQNSESASLQPTYYTLMPVASNTDISGHFSFQQDDDSLEIEISARLPDILQGYQYVVWLTFDGAPEPVAALKKRETGDYTAVIRVVERQKESLEKIVISLERISHELSQPTDILLSSIF